MLEVGVCGTDKEICSFEYGTPPEGSDYLILGHESLGFVGTVSAAVGVGLLLSGYVSLKLSRKMGLINGQSHAPASKEIARSV